MKIYIVTEECFKKYGRIIQNIDFWGGLPEGCHIGLTGENLNIELD